MDTPLPSHAVMRRRRSALLATAAVLMSLAAGALAVRHTLTPALDAADVRIATARRGDIASTINASGIVMPLHEELVTSPVATRVARVHAKIGQRVAKDALLLELDDKAIRLAHDSISEQLAQQENRIEGLTLELEQKRKQLESQIELLQLDLESARVKRERYTTLRKAGGVSGEDMLAAELNVKRVEIELRQRRELIVDTGRSTRSSIEGARLQKNILQKQLGQQIEQLARTQVKAPFEGVLTMLAQDEGASVAAGQLVARVSEPGNYRVEATLSDFHARSLAPGQAVRIEQGRDTLRGRVDTVLPEMEGGAMRLWIALEQPDHPLLRNKMRVETSIITGEKRDRIIIDTGAAINGTGRQHLYLVQDGVARKAMVEVGAGDGKVVELMAGAAPGQRFIVSDTSSFRQHDTIGIK